MATADTNFPGDNMTLVNVVVDGGPRLNVDNGNGGLKSVNAAATAVSIPTFESKRLITAKLVA
jgi:hypothetical protein